MKNKKIFENRDKLGKKIMSGILSHPMFELAFRDGFNKNNRRRISVTIPQKTE